MSNKEFTNIVIQLVKDYANEHLDKSDNIQITEDDVYIVWLCKTLQNHKALASTKLLDGMYYEITYNGDMKQIYLDAYKKIENRCIELQSPPSFLEKKIHIKQTPPNPTIHTDKNFTRGFWKMRKYENVNINKLKPYENNARTHSD